MILILLIILAYILGSIPNAVWIGKVFKGIDVREYGSKNTGSTNAARVLGAKLGILTLILDVSKGAIPVLIVKYIYNNVDIDIDIDTLSTIDIKLILVGIVAILGHSFSIFLKFKGGKAVATTLGVFLVLTLKAILISAIAFFLVFAIYKYVSLSSMVASIVLPISIWFIYNNILYTLFAVIISILIIIRHKSNIKRILNGTETKFSIKKDKK